MKPVTWAALSLGLPWVTPKHAIRRAEKFTEFRKDSIRAAEGLTPAALSRAECLMPVVRAALGLAQKFTEFRKDFILLITCYHTVENHNITSSTLNS